MMGIPPPPPQTVPPAPKGGSVALQYGALFSLIPLGVAILFDIVDYFAHLSSSLTIGIFHLLFGPADDPNAPSSLNQYDTANTVALLLLALTFALIAGGVAIVAGRKAARKTGRVVTGTLAGLWAGAFFGVIFLPFDLVITYWAVIQSGSALTPGGSNTLQSVAQLFSDITQYSITRFDLPLVAMAICAGTACGAWGGSMGRKQWKRYEGHFQT